MTTFTPGPWSVTSDDGDGLEAKFYIQDERGNEIAAIEVFSAEEDDNGDLQPDALYGANAALIAAAPDLYEALASCSAWLSRWGQHAGKCHDGIPCTCGLVAMRAEAEAALALVQERSQEGDFSDKETHE